MLVEEFELGVLWDQYGLVGDVVVSNFLASRFSQDLLFIFFIYSHLQIISPGQTFTSSSHPTFYIN
jgi:hypothetical protein